MLLLTLAGLVQCGHQGVVQLAALQSFVFVSGSPVLVRPDPEAKAIVACPVPPAPGAKPCTQTLPLQQGYSSKVFIDGIPVCREDARGNSDGVPPGAAFYRVTQPGQHFVSEPS